MTYFHKKTKFLFFLLLILTITVQMISCTHATDSTGSEVDKNGKENDLGGDSENVACEHSYVDDAENSIKAKALLEGKNAYKCEKCGDSYADTVPATKSLKVLAIGNSFSEDAMAHLYGICKSAGIEEIVLGNLFIGGCSLDAHRSNIQNGSAVYDFQLNTDGTWKHNYKYTVEQGIKYTDWDFITIQQVSGLSGLGSTYGSMHTILEYLEANKPKDTTEFYFHMTWAYQQDSKHSDFSKYGKSQIQMYQKIVEATKNKVLEDSLIDGVIPSGTAIQNLRTSSLGDTLTRDGYHLSLDVGRYTAAMSWFVTLTGGSCDDVDYIGPSDMYYIEICEKIVKKAVENSNEKPYEVTEF